MSLMDISASRPSHNYGVLSTRCGRPRLVVARPPTAHRGDSRTPPVPQCTVTSQALLPYYASGLSYSVCAFSLYLSFSFLSLSMFLSVSICLSLSVCLALSLYFPSSLSPHFSLSCFLHFRVPVHDVKAS